MKNCSFEVKIKGLSEQLLKDNFVLKNSITVKFYLISGMRKYIFKGK